jgi:hypothetical protein
MAVADLECARCDDPATVLIVHPHLYLMVIPLCALDYVLQAPDCEPIDIKSPEGQEVLETHTVLRGFVVPRQER